MISVTMTGADTYEVVVGAAHRGGPEPAAEARCLATLSGDCYKALSGGAFTHEWVLVQVFRHLLERAGHGEGPERPSAKLPERLDVAELCQRLPDLADDVARRLGR